MATIDQFGGPNDTLASVPLGGPTGWAAAVAAQGKWKSWTSTPTGFTVSAQTCRYTRIGDTVHINAMFTVATVTGAVSFSLPLPCVSATGTPFQARLVDTGTNTSFSAGRFLGGGNMTAQIEAESPNTNGVGVPITPTFPFAWAAGDVIFVSGTYETDAAQTLAADEPQILPAPEEVVIPETLPADPPADEAVPL